MKVTIDPDRCQGHARCIFFAREIFEIDEDGYAKVRPGFEEVPLELQASAEKACANCPERAISIVRE